MSNWFEGEVLANGITIHYHRTGTTGKPILVLLHGVTDSGRVWVRIAHALENDYDIVMPDARGHGQSDDLASGFSIPILADDVAGVIQGLSLGKPSLWGHSMGAITAATVAANYPELVHVALLEDPPFLSVQAIEEAASREQAAASRAPSFPDFRTIAPEARLSIAAAMNPRWHADELPPWAESKAQFDPAIGQHFGSFRSHPWREVLMRITCPTLLITGDHTLGAIVTPETAQEAMTLLKQGELIQIANSGHNIHREGYEQTMQAVQAFLSAHA